MVIGNFREFTFFNVSSNSFSVSIKSNELSEEQIQKCFEELVVKKLNDLYLVSVNEEIQKQNLKKKFELNSELLKKNLDYNNIKIKESIESSFDTEQRIVYLKSINFFLKLLLQNCLRPRPRHNGTSERVETR
jgi:hypothetical protein